jgi:uncharacterized protein (TIGR02217 family)
MTKPSRFVIPSGTDLTLDPDVLPYVPGRTFIKDKRPQWKTQINEAISGRETSRKIWSYPKWHFELNHEFLRNPVLMSDSELVKILAFFNAKCGRWKEFLFMDDEDNAVTDMQFGIGNGSITSFQCTRTMSVGQHTFTEPVRAFYATPVVKVNGVTTAVTINDYGNFVFASAPAGGAVLTWTGQFFYVCRFEEDEMSFEQMFSRIWSNESLMFVSIKP